VRVCVVVCIAEVMKLSCFIKNLLNVIEVHCVQFHCYKYSHIESHAPISGLIIKLLVTTAQLLMSAVEEESRAAAAAEWVGAAAARAWRGTQGTVSGC
jgi:hypothetical protein